MSSRLTVEPINRIKLTLGTSIKFALRKKLGEHINSEIDSSFISFLEGIVAAGDFAAKQDAEKLIEFLNIHGTALLKEEY